ncbi:MAG: hypothetical protein U0271_02870 [Polyangiaceae bacterium]
MNSPSDLIASQLAEAHRTAVALGESLRVGLGSWRVLLGLALAAPAGERASLAPLVERAGTSNGALEPRCLAGLCGLLPEGEALARLRAALERVPSSQWDVAGIFIAALPEQERSRVLPIYLEQALTLAGDVERWDACDALTMLPNPVESRQWERSFGEACLARYGRVSEDPYRWLEGEPTPAQRAAIRELEIARWGASFEAWRLGDEASKLPEAERGPALDRAMAAFEELIGTPVDPGNDEGPFWAIARYLSVEQVRRALAILGRMKAEDWCYALAGSKAALLTRLAWLGQSEEALAVLLSIGKDGEFDGHWRATAWGGWISGRLANEASLTLAQALQAAEVHDPKTLSLGEGRFRVLSELCYRVSTHWLPMDAPAVAEECIGEVQALRRHDAKLGRILMEECIGAWCRALPTERWLQLITEEEDGPTRLELYEALFESERDAARAPGLALRRLLDELRQEKPLYPALLLKWLLGERARLSPDDLLPAWRSWLALAGEPSAGFPATVRELDGELGALVAYLGGPDAPAAACRALAAVCDELSKP